MTAVTRILRSKRQPTHLSRIDRSHPLAAGLKVAWVGGQELATGSPTVRTGGSWAADCNGRHWVAGGSGSVIELPGVRLQYTTGGYDELTVIALGEFSASGVTNAICSYTPLIGGNEGWTLKAEQYADAGQVGFTHHGTPEADVTSGIATPSGYAFIGVSVTQAGHQFLVNDSASSLVGPNLVMTGTANQFRLGIARGTSDPMIAGSKLHAVFVWERALSLAELRALRRDPYQILRAAIPGSYVFEGAGGGSFFETLSESLSLSENVAVIKISAANIVENNLLTENSSNTLDTNSVNVAEIFSLDEDALQSAFLLSELIETLSLNATAAIPQIGIEYVRSASFSQAGLPESILFSDFVVDGTDKLLLVFIARHPTDDTGITGVAFNGEALTLIEQTFQYNTTGRLQVWALVNPTSTTADITWTTSGLSSGNTSAIAALFTGVDQAVPIINENTVFSSTANQSVSVTSDVGDYIVAIASAWATDFNTPPAGQTQLDITTTHIRMQLTDKQGTATSTTMGAAMTGSVSVGMIGFVIQPSSVAPVITNVTNEEAFVLAESNSSFLFGSVLASETFALDSNQTSAVDLIALVDEVFLLSEDSNSSFTTLNSLTEAFNLVEEQDSIFTVTSEVTEALVLSNVETTYQILNALYSDSFVLTETISSLLSDISNIAETFTLVTFVSPDGVVSLSITEENNLTDAQTSTLSFTGESTNNFELVDQLQANLLIESSITETSNLDEGTVSNLELSSTAIETLNLTEQNSYLSGSTESVTEVFSLTEALQDYLIFNAQVLEELNLVDITANTLNSYVTITENTSLNDFSSISGSVDVSITEVMVANDNAALLKILIVSRNENLTLDSTASNEINFTTIQTNNFNLIDTAVDTGIFNHVSEENFLLTENTFAGGVQSLEISESLNLLETLQQLITINLTSENSFSLEESSVGIPILVVNLTEVLSLEEETTNQMIFNLMHFALMNFSDVVIGCKVRVPNTAEQPLIENVRKFYDTDFYIVDDLVAYSKGPSTYLTPVYVVGLADYCCYYNPNTSSLVLEQKDIFDDIWVEVDSIPISQVPESISFTFDQNGYPAIVWEQNRNMWLYWYDSLMADTVITNKGPGYSPRIKLETFNEILQPVRTAILAYTSVDGQLVYLRQNERYETLHVLENEGVHGVASLSHTARNSLKLSYLIDRGLFDYNLENYSTERLGEWYGDNAVGRVDFLVDEFQIRSVIYGPTVENMPIDGEHLVSGVTVEVVPVIIPYEAPHEKPVSGFHTISAMTVEVVPIVISVPVDDEMRGPISHEYEPISLAITDIRIDYFHDQDYFSPISHEYESIGLGFAYTKSTLLQAITAYSALPESDFTPATWDVLEGAIIAAQAVYDNGSATQNEIDVAGFNLDRARLSLDGRVVLLLHGNGANNSTVFTDFSGNGRTFTVGGNAKISTAWSQFGGASMLFDGSGDYLSGETIDDYRFANDFCVDFWVNKINNVGNQTLVDFREGGSLTSAPAFVIYTWQSVPVSTLAVYTTGANIMIGPVIEVGVPTHIEVSRTAGIMRMFVNGILVSSVVNSTNFTHGKVSVGSDGNFSSPLNGYIDELRIKRGGGHLENFTPPVAEYS